MADVKVTIENIKRAFDDAPRRATSAQKKVLEFYELSEQIAEQVLNAQNKYVDPEGRVISTLFDDVEKAADQMVHLVFGDSGRQFGKGIIGESRKKRDNNPFDKPRVLMVDSPIGGFKMVDNEITNKPKTKVKLNEFVGDFKGLVAYTEKFKYSFKQLRDMLKVKSGFSDKRLGTTVYRPNVNMSQLNPQINYQDEMKFANLLIIAYKESIAQEVRDFFDLKMLNVSEPIQYTMNARGYFLSTFFREYGRITIPNAIFKKMTGNRQGDIKGQFRNPTRSGDLIERFVYNRQGASKNAAMNEAINDSAWAFINIALLRLLRWFTLEKLRLHLAQSLESDTNNPISKEDLEEKYTYKYMEESKVITYDRNFYQPFYAKPTDDNIKTALRGVPKIDLAEEQEEDIQTVSRRPRGERQTQTSRSPRTDATFEQPMAQQQDVQALVEELRKTKEFQSISDTEIIRKLRSLARTEILGGDPEFQKAFVLLVRKLALS